MGKPITKPLVTVELTYASENVTLGYAECGGVDAHMCIYITDAGKADEVKAFVISKLKLNPVDFKSVVIDNIPKNNAGKQIIDE